ncbi:hypothetical protein [Nocardia aurantiaca]|uniref:Uncharacterized protein n=1 Tax=Nocardia aurantiaca TaxID=2675850 RepID=A0A6I3KUM8_9NOCA|nr:hypothetical protein [Nocardia aurantiaca]MTE13672.1 hypothetical protein [Nocardia aurantiaca]
MTDERAALKSEQLERIKQRDTFLNLNIVALGVVMAVALPGQRPAGIWLVVPWITAILGWAYLSNDDKVSAIARHLRLQVRPADVASAWETSNKGLLRPRIRWIADVATFLLSYIVPTPVALALFVVSTPGSPRTVGYVIMAVESAVTSTLAGFFVASALQRRRA